MAPTDRTTIMTHPDTYAARLGAFTTYDGVTLPQSHEWTDTTTPRTGRPVRFIPRAPEWSKARALHPQRPFPSFTIRWA